MNILFFSPTPTHQPVAGNRARILAVATNLIESGHAVHFAWVPMDEGDQVAMRAFFEDRFHVLVYRHPPAVRSLFARSIRKWRRLIGDPRAYIWNIDDWYDMGLSEQVEALHARYSFDAVIVEYVYMSRVLEVFPDSVLKIIDTHDRFADRHLQFLKVGKEPEWFSTTRENERKGLARAHIILTIQEGEALEFQALLDGTVQVMTLGHLLDMSSTVAMSTAARAVFIGSGNPINGAGVMWFVNEVLPLLRTEVPDFELLLAGDICNQISDAPGVRKLGRVASVSDAYAQGSLAVNPVSMGTGLCIKTLECLALGVPLVSTESGSRGVEGLRGLAFMCVPDNDAPMMAASILSVWKNESLRVRLASEARKAAQKWNAEQLAMLAEITTYRVPMWLK